MKIEEIKGFESTERTSELIKGKTILYFDFCEIFFTDGTSLEIYHDDFNGYEYTFKNPSE